MGDSPHHKRMQPVRVTPEGRQHLESSPVPVTATLRFHQPPLSYQVEAWVVSWTRQAVLIFWLDHRGAASAGWIPAQDVQRTASAGR